MYTFFSILIFIACLLLILVVLVQNPKGGGLASEFSAADRIGGVQQTADFLERATWTLAVGIMVLTLVQAAFVDTGGQQQKQQGNPLEEVIDEQMDQRSPMTPDQGAPGQGGTPGGQQQPPQGQGSPEGQGGQGGQEGGASGSPEGSGQEDPLEGVPQEQEQEGNN